MPTAMKRQGTLRDTVGGAELVVKRWTGGLVDWWTGELVNW
ncbi:MAG: hypothetical protein ACJ79A_12515 [Gemmatimonadaceae bacterium]